MAYLLPPGIELRSSNHPHAPTSHRRKLMPPRHLRPAHDARRIQARRMPRRAHHANCSRAPLLLLGALLMALAVFAGQSLFALRLASTSDEEISTLVKDMNQGRRGRGSSPANRKTPHPRSKQRSTPRKIQRSTPRKIPRIKGVANLRATSGPRWIGEADCPAPHTYNESSHTPCRGLLNNVRLVCLGVCMAARGSSGFAGAHGSTTAPSHAAVRPLRCTGVTPCAVRPARASPDRAARVQGGGLRLVCPAPVRVRAPPRLPRAAADATT